MTIEQDIADWARTRPEWQRDVLARLCRNEQIGEATIEQIASSLIAGGSLRSASILPADIPGGTTSAKSVQLRALRDIKGVNALTPNQKLTFADSGLTVIYGNNASGKSGYARLIRKAVAARVQSDVLGNVFTENEPLERCAVIEYIAGNGNSNGSGQKQRAPNSRKSTFLTRSAEKPTSVLRQRSVIDPPLCPCSTGW